MSRKTDAMLKQLRAYGLAGGAPVTKSLSKKPAAKKPKTKRRARA